MNENGDLKLYGGRERRLRVVYVTRNTEYHFKSGRCIAVRERTTGSWLLTHPALNRAISASIRYSRNLDAYPSLDPPRVGEGLLFATDGPEVVTSNLEAIGRPEKATVGCYPV